MSKPYLIGEVGINANGDVNLAKKLIKQAKDTGWDAVKFQKRDIETVYSRDMLESPRQSPWGTSQRDQKRGIEFDKSDYDQIDKYCKEIGITWFASAWDMNSWEFLKQYDLKFNKIASAMLTNWNFCSSVAGAGKHTFISTGMSTYKDIDWVVNMFKRSSTPFTLLHCVSTYPCKDEDCNIEMIRTLQKKYQCNVGYSGHEKGLTPSMLAIALGAKVIERHITLDRSSYGSDQSASLEKHGMEILSREAELIAGMLGDGEKRILDGEMECAKKLRYWGDPIHAN